MGNTEVRICVFFLGLEVIGVSISFVVVFCKEKSFFIGFRGRVGCGSGVCLGLEVRIVFLVVGNFLVFWVGDSVV